MVRESLLDINQHENKWCGAAETPAELYIGKLQSVLDNPHLTFYGMVKGSV